METLVLTSHGTILQIGEGVVKDFFLAEGNFFAPAEEHDLLLVLTCRGLPPPFGPVPHLEGG